MGIPSRRQAPHGARQGQGSMWRHPAAERHGPLPLARYAFGAGVAGCPCPQ